MAFHCALERWLMPVLSTWFKANYLEYTQIDMFQIVEGYPRKVLAAFIADLIVAYSQIFEIVPFDRGQYHGASWIDNVEACVKRYILRSICRIISVLKEQIFLISC